MKLLELTDFNTKTLKEYIVIEKLVRIEPHTRQFEKIKTDTREVEYNPGLLARIVALLTGGGIIAPKTITETYVVSREVVDRNGSLVVLSGDAKTMVLETPEEIAKLLADGTKTTEVKGA